MSGQLSQQADAQSSGALPRAVAFFGAYSRLVAVGLAERLYMLRGWQLASESRASGSIVHENSSQDSRDLWPKLCVSLAGHIAEKRRDEGPQAT
jgi:hypothetical protein